MKPLKKVSIIINPGSQPNTPVLGQLNTVLTNRKIKWDIQISKSNQDAVKLAQEAVQKNPDAVAVFGGDGTVLAVASILYKNTIPLIIIPGGTANVMAKELGVPLEIPEALKVFTRSPKLIEVDTILCDDGQPFFLRIEVGAFAKMVTDVPRRKKRAVGILAYPLAALKQLLHTNPYTYHLQIDDLQLTVRGVSLMIANSANVGIAGVSVRPNVSCSDGIIDIFVLQSRDLKSMLMLVMSMLLRTKRPVALKHWKGKKVSFQLPHTQKIVRDDTIVETNALTAEIIPTKLRVLV